MDKNHPSYFCGKSHSVIVRNRVTGQVISCDIPVEYIESLFNDMGLEVRVVGTKYSKPYLIGKKGEKKIINYK
jgi:hypothetical protein